MAFIKQAEKDGTLYELNPRSVAEQFSASTAYAAGDHVYYDGTLYCFTTAHAAGAWNANHVTAVTVGAELTNLKADLDQKANADGYYEEMSVGNAEQLISSTYTEDKTPYLFRTSGGSADIGNREENIIVGGTINWNQVEPLDASEYVIHNPALFSFSLSNGVYQALVKSDTNNYKTARLATITPEHKYYASYDGACHATDYGVQVVIADNTGSLNSNPVAFPSIAKNTSDFVHYAGIVAAGATNTAFGFKFAGGTPKDNYAEIKNIILCDLTAMFGTEIADNIYALEQAETGAGVAWFKKLFPKDYYPYNAGELLSVSGLQSHDMVGFNQWDEEVEAGQYNSETGAKESYSGRYRSKNFIPCFPDTTYYHNVSMQIFYYDDNKNFISVIPGGILSARTFKTPSNCHYMTFVITSDAKNAGNICINLSWSGYRNGEYEEYAKHSYPLDSTLTLRGIPMLDAAGNLYYDGDRYLPDGTVTRTFKEYDLGDLTWTHYEASGDNCAYFTSTIIPGASRVEIAEPYGIRNGTSSSFLELAPDKTIGVNTNAGMTARKLYVRDDSYSSTEEFKAAVTGVKVLVRMTAAYVITETAQPYQTPQAVDDFGTEEYVTTSIVPVGHETKYLANLRDKLQHLPDLADADGYYLIQQTGHEMDLVRFRIPQAPATDGTYVLKATVSGGTPTYTWVNDSQEEVTEP